MIIQSSPTLLLSDDSNKIANRISSTLLLLTNKDGKITSLSPLNAPDADFLQWIDFSDNDKLDFSGDSILKAYFSKVKDSPTGTYYQQGVSSAPKKTGVINSLQSANFESTSIMQLEEYTSVPAGYNFAYPSMTFFLILRPTAGGHNENIGQIIADVGSGTEIMIIRLGNGTNLQLLAFMRDSSNNVVSVTSDTQYLNVNTDYLIVVKLDGANKRVTIYIDGATSYTATNASYDNTTTFEGGSQRAAIGESAVTTDESYQGYIGSIFVTKTAISNADINKYAQWMANKWGTTWVDISE